MIKRFRYIYVCLIAVLACCVSTSVSAQSVFAHYKGVNNLDYINGMQQVHEYEYTYYVEAGKRIDLTLPFQGYDNIYSTRNDEPKGYIRWYDYKTDLKSNSLVKWSPSTGLLQEVYDADGKNRGFFAWKTVRLQMLLDQTKLSKVCNMYHQQLRHLPNGKAKILLVM